MNGAESLVHTLLASGVDTCFCQSGHLGDAFRRRAGPDPGHALRARPVRGRGDRRRRRLRAGRGQAGGDPAALRARARQRPGQPAQRAPRLDADRQHRRRPGDLSPAQRPAADRRHRGLGAGRLRLGAHRDRRRHRRGRRSGGRAGGDGRAGPDRHPDPPLRHLLERGRGRRRAAARACRRRSPPPTRSTRRPRSCGAAARAWC